MTMGRPPRDPSEWLPCLLDYVRVGAQEAARRHGYQTQTVRKMAQDFNLKTALLRNPESCAQGLDSCYRLLNKARCLLALLRRDLEYLEQGREWCAPANLATLEYQIRIKREAITFQEELLQEAGTGKFSVTLQVARCLVQQRAGGADIVAFHPVRLRKAG